MKSVEMKEKDKENRWMARNGHRGSNDEKIVIYGKWCFASDFRMKLHNLKLEYSFPFQNSAPKNLSTVLKWTRLLKTFAVKFPMKHFISENYIS